jgi:hypothetical protein
MLSTSDIKRALRQAGFEVYRTEGTIVHIADRVRENLIMDSGIRVDGGRDVVVVYVRAQKRDFPGENEDELFGRARGLAEPALAQGYREARTFMTELLDPGNPERILDLWYQVQLEKAVESLAVAIDEVRFAHTLVKTSTR